MKYILTVLFTFTLYCVGFAQSGTEIYLFDLDNNGSVHSISNPLNITNNPGYDNQPSFLSDDSGVIFVATRNSQTDIALYGLVEEMDDFIFISDTEAYSEYSPVQIPGGGDVSHIILTTDGVQEFRKLFLADRSSDLIEGEDIIGYYSWYDSNSYLCFVLATENAPSTVQWHNIASGEKKIIGEQPGRSFHKIPGTNTMSYILKEAENWNIYNYSPETGSSRLITATISESEDMAWTPSQTIIMGKGSALFEYSMDTWNQIADLSEFGLSGITRLAISNDGSKIAIVVDE